MPITEFATFRFKEPFTLDSDEVRTKFRTLSIWQSEWSKYHLTFYNATEDPALVYLISGWDNISAHMEWIESERNQTLLKIFDPILSIVDFVHLEIDFAQIPPETQVLAFKKVIENEKDIDYAIRSEEFVEGEKLWSGQGRAIEKTENYILVAYRNAKHSTTKESGPSQLATLRRLDFI
jgi:hypothetical protein